jgi:hypothetical protein
MPSAHRRAPERRAATRIALAKFEAELEAIVTAGLPAKMPDVLYHYTTWPGFRGIVSSQRVHARAHHCTNDPAELTSIDAILTDVAEGLERTVGAALRPPLNAFLRDLPGRKIAKAATVYLACFSVAKDKPSQWRSYADGGKGVCLGFKVLHDEHPPIGMTLASLPVAYDEDAWRTNVRERFRQVVDCHSRFGRQHHGAYSAGAPAVWSALMRIAAVASIGAKGPEWSSEEEWRTLVLDWGKEHTPLFKPDGSEYVELRLREPPLLFVFEEILLGPRQDLAEADAIAEARHVLEGAGYTAGEMPPIRVSSVDVSG